MSRMYRVEVEVELEPGNHLVKQFAMNELNAWFEVESKRLVDGCIEVSGVRTLAGGVSEAEAHEDLKKRMRGMPVASRWYFMERPPDAEFPFPEEDE